MQNNYLQSFGSYQQHQQNTSPIFKILQAHQIQYQILISQHLRNQYYGLPPINANNNQFASTKTATNQSSELPEIENLMKLLLQREISCDQNSTSNLPSPTSPTCNICNKKGHLAKKCFTTKTCLKCNNKGHI